MKHIFLNSSTEIRIYLSRRNATFQLFRVSGKKIKMKPFLNLLFIILGVLILGPSCAKKNDAPTSILGKWNIKIDSSYTGGGFTNHEASYVGQAGDFFNFNSDGHIYIKENSIFDTLNYTLSSGALIVQNFGYDEGKCQVSSPTTNSLIISSGYFITPNGEFGRTVYLTR